MGVYNSITAKNRLTEHTHEEYVKKKKMESYTCLTKVYDYNIYYYRVTKVLCVQCAKFTEMDEEKVGYPHLIVSENLRSYRICHRCRRILHVASAAYVRY